MGRLLYININVTDLERTISFYEAIGFTLMYRFNPDQQIMRDTARVYSEPPNEELDAAFMRIGEQGNATCLDLCQWRTRPTYGQAQESTNQVGLCRLTVSVEDLVKVVTRLEEAGYEPIGDIVELPLWEDKPPAKMAAFRDPDGVFIQVGEGMDPLVD